MSWSMRLGRVAGIPIYVHWTFLLLIAWIVLSHQLAGHDLATTAEGVAFVLTIFGCVVLHELGHALMASRFGVVTSDITLFPIGGLGRLARIPENPVQEFLIALAGPAVNLAIVVALLLAGVRLPGAVRDPELLVGTGFLARLMIVNVFLAVFNLLPAFPMDGGRVFRALLAMRLDYGRATRIAAAAGQGMAVVFGFVGLSVGNPVLVLIAAFVWLGAQSEASYVQERILLRGLRVRDAMSTNFKTVNTNDTLAAAAELLLGGFQHEFPVVSGDRITGVLTRDDLIAGLARGGGDAKVADYFQPKIGTVDVNSLLDSAVEPLIQGQVPCLKVMDGEIQVGLITLDHIRDFLLVRSTGYENQVRTRVIPPHDRRKALAT
jgi:Zn-dependent protease